MKQKQIQIRRLYYHLKHHYFTVNNAVIAIAVVVALSWAWGSIAMMQRNYALQRRLDAKERELVLTQLEVETLKYEQAYYQTREYQELAARRHLGLGKKGEKVLYLPENSQAAKDYGKEEAVSQPVVELTNFEQWLNFLSGRNARDLSEKD
jgi:cell division protein FtsB